MGLLFATLLGIEHEEGSTAWALWNSVKFDRPKRELLSAAKENLTREAFAEWSPKAEAEIRWLIDRVNALEDDRNNVVHSPLLYVGDSSEAKEAGRKPYVAPVFIFGNQRAMRLADKDLMTEFRYVRDAAAILAKYTSDMERTLANDSRGQISWPKRPSLPNRGQKKSRPSQPRLQHKE